MQIAKTIEVSLVNGEKVAVIASKAAVAVEKDSNQPRTVAESDGILYLLSTCCGASAKGSAIDYEDGTSESIIVCRNCYEEIWSDSGKTLREDDIIRISPSDLLKVGTL